MLKRARSKSTFRAGEKKISSSTMNHVQTAHAGDRKRTCALTNEACQILNELRKKNLLCDARISAKKDPMNQDSEFSVHRFILAGKILSFRSNDVTFFQKVQVRFFVWLLPICRVNRHFYN